MSGQSAKRAHRRVVFNAQVVIPAVAVVLAALIGVLPMLLRKSRPPPLGDIASPAMSARVGTTFEVRGTASEIPEAHALWIAVQVDNLLWPKIRVPDTRGTFMVTVSEEGERDRRFALALLVVSPRGARFIARWLEEGGRTGDFPGIASIPGTSVLDVHPLIHD